MEYDRKQLKRTAKALVHDTRPKVWVTTLFYILLTTVAVNVVTSLVPNPFTEIILATQMYPEYLVENPELVMAMLGAASGGMLLTLFVSVLTSLYQAVMRYGYAGYTLKVWRRGETAHTDIFSGFPMAGRIIGASVMVGIFTFLWIMLLFLGVFVLAMMAIMLMSAVDFLAVIMLIALYILLFIGIFFITYRYSLTPYFLMSDPDLGVMEAITASKTAMRGNYKKRFVLDLSFLGWSLLLALIIYAVVFGGFMILFWGNFAAIQQGMDPAALLLTVGLPGILILVLAFAISLPLNLWLTSYISVTEAGFFETVKALPATQSRLERHIAGTSPYAYGGVPPIPPAPPVEEPEDAAAEPSPEPVVPEEPAAPQEPTAPEEPPVPQEPETPQEPSGEEPK